jgi:hypothetical protein
MRADWREGREDKVIDWLKGFRSDHALWQALSSEVKADLLRFEANLQLEITGEISRARQLAEEARGLIPSVSDVRLQALITYIETGPKSAIKLLNGLEDIASLNLKATLLLEMGRIDRCREVLSSKSAITQSNAETFRIRSLFYLLTKERK